MVAVRLFVDGNRYLALDALLERDERLGAYHAVDALQFVVQKVHELLVVAGIELHEHGVGTCGEVTFHHLGDSGNALYNLFIHTAALKVETHVGAGGVAEALGVHVETASCDHATFDKVLHALVDGGARNATFGCYVLERDACILRENVQNLPFLHQNAPPGAFFYAIYCQFKLNSIHLLSYCKPEDIFSDIYLTN